MNDKISFRIIGIVILAGLVLAFVSASKARLPGTNPVVQTSR